MGVDEVGNDRNSRIIYRGGHDEVFAGKSGQSITQSANSNIDFLTYNGGEEVDLLCVRLDGHSLLYRGSYNISHAEVFRGCIFFESLILFLGQLLTVI